MITYLKIKTLISKIIINQSQRKVPNVLPELNKLEE